MDNWQIQAILKKQEKFFKSGKTQSVNVRKAMLVRIKKSIKKYEPQIHAALYKDLGKSRTESIMTETGFALSEISYMLKNIDKFAKTKKVRTPLAQFAAVSFTKPVPYGNVLIMSPWNYPFLLTISPLIAAIAAGNTAVVKPSAYSENVSKVLKQMLSECCPDSYIAVVTGGREENEALLKQKFDYIFFTGSKSVGRYVMECAAKHLTPLTLELGGKSPCIIDESADLKLTARRIVFGKLINVGQTCVAPDYILCKAECKDELIREICREIKRQYSTDPMNNPSYGRIINQKHFDRLIHLIDSDKVVYGGESIRKELKIEPTVMDHVTFEDKVMQEEIFGPVLPIITYTDLDKVIRKLNDMPHPLALYLFSTDSNTIRKVIRNCQFGGGCINDTIIHLATSNMGFGGVGESGMGAYHGKTGFDTFSHYKSIVDKKNQIDLSMRYQPYSFLHEKMIRCFLR